MEGVLTNGLRALDSPRILVLGKYAVGFLTPGGSGGAGAGSPSVMIDFEGLNEGGGVSIRGLKVV